MYQRARLLCFVAVLACGGGFFSDLRAQNADPRFTPYAPATAPVSVSTFPEIALRPLIPSVASGSSNQPWLAAEYALPPAAGPGEVKVYVHRVHPAALRPATDSLGRFEIRPAGAVVNANTATRSQLEALPGIGRASAAKILAARQLGPFANIVEIRYRTGISDRIIKAAQERLAAW